MSRDASGNYTLPAGNPVVSGETIESAWANGTMNDIKEALTDSLSRTGLGGMVSAFKFVNGALGAPGASFINDATTGMWLSAAADLRFSAGGVQALRLQGTSATFPGTVSGIGGSFTTVTVGTSTVLGNNSITSPSLTSKTTVSNIRISIEDASNTGSSITLVANNTANPGTGDIYLQADDAVGVNNPTVQIRCDRAWLAGKTNGSIGLAALNASTKMVLSSADVTVGMTGVGNKPLEVRGSTTLVDATGVLTLAGASGITLQGAVTGTSATFTGSYTGSAVGGIHLSNFSDLTFIVSAGAPSDVFTGTKPIQLLGSATTVKATTGALTLDAAVGAVTITSGANTTIDADNQFTATGATAVTLTATTGGATLRALNGSLSLSGTSSATLSSPSGAISLTASGGNLTLYSSSQITIRKAGSTGSTAIRIVADITEIMAAASNTIPAILLNTAVNQINYRMSTQGAIAITNNQLNMYGTTGGFVFQVSNNRFRLLNLPTYAQAIAGDLFKGPALSGGGFSVGIK